MQYAAVPAERERVDHLRHLTSAFVIVMCLDFESIEHFPARTG